MTRSKKSESIWWQVFVDATEKLPRAEQAKGFAKLAAMLAYRGERSAAALMALRASREARELGERNPDESIRQALSSVTAGYHSQIATDEVRIAAWEAALREVIRPGMLVLEIGTGSGILAMLAARAGAQVVSCENDPVLAALAEETLRLNGLDRRIHVVRKSSQDLRAPADLPGLADLLMLDLFANRLFDFRPFELIRSARRLLRPDAVSVPREVSLETALADFKRWFRLVPGRVSGFDLSTLGDLSAGSISLDPREPDLSLRSAAETIVRAALPADLPGETGISEKIMISGGGPVNGLAVWLRVDLARGQVLEAKPGLAPHGFYARPVFYAFRKTLNTVAGQPCRVRLRWEGNAASVSHVEQ